MGFGAKSTTDEVCMMIAESLEFIESVPWVVTLPGLCILVVVLACKVFGDGLMDAFDPRLNLTFTKAQHRTVRAALSNTFGFGGHNASVIFRKYS